MAEYNALNLILTAEYVGGGAIKAMSNDIKGMVAETSGLSRLGAGFSALGNIFLAAGTTMAVGMGIAVKQAMEYDDAINRIIAVHGIYPDKILTARDAHDALTASLIKNRNELQALNAEIADASVKFGLKPTDVAKGAYFMFSALPAMNLTSGQALGYNVIKDLAAYTRASGPADQGGVNFGQAAQDIPRLMAAYNTPIGQWGNQMGTLTFLENSAHLTQAQLVQSMTKFLPAAGALGMNFGDSATLMAALSTTGVFGSRAGTEASSALFHLFSGTPSALKGLGALGLDTNKMFGKDGKLLAPDQLLFSIAGQLGKMPRDQALNAEKNLLGMVGNRAFGPLFATGMDKYASLMRAENSAFKYGGPQGRELYMQAVAGSMMDSPKAKLSAMMSAFELLGITVGNKLMPYVLRAVDGLTRLALALSGVVANSHSVGDFFKNILGALFGKSPVAGAVGNIGAGLMNSKGGGMLLGTLGLLFGSGLGFKALGGGLSMLGGVDHALAGKGGLGGVLMGTLFGTTPKMGPLQTLFGGREGGMLSGLFGPSRGLAMRLDTLIPQFGLPHGPHIDWARLFPATARANDLRSILGALGPHAGGKAGELGMVLGGLKQDMPGLLKGGLGGAHGGIQGAIHGMQGPVMLDGFKALRQQLIALPFHVDNLSQAFRVKLGQGLLGIGGHAKQAGESLKQFGAQGVFGAAEKTKGFAQALPRLALQGLGGLRGALVNVVPMLLGFGTAALPIIAIVLLIAGAIAIGVLAFTKFRTQTMAALGPLFAEVHRVFDSIKLIIMGAVQSIQDKWKQMWPQIKPAMEQFLAAVKQMGPVWTVIGTVIKLVVGIIITVIVGLVSGFLKALPAIIRVFTGIVQVITNVSAIIVDIFTGKWGQIPKHLKGIVDGIWKIISGGFMMVLNFIGGFALGVLNFINKMTHGALQGVIDWVHGIINWAKHLWEQLVGHSIIPDMVNGIIKWFKELPGKVIGMIVTFVLTLIDHFNQLKTRVGAAIQLLIDLGKQKFQDLVDNVLKTVGGLKDKLTNLGHDMMMGLVNGITNNAQAVANAVKNAVGGALDGAKHLLGIKSPSKVFHYFGAMSMEGFAQGFKSNTSAHEAMKALLPGGKLQLGAGGKLAINSLHVDNLHLPKDAFPQAAPREENRSIAAEYLFARQVQREREESTGLYNRRSTFDQSYRYASQYTQ